MVNHQSTDFPTPVLQPIATNITKPTYFTIRRAQLKLNGNAISVPSLTGGRRLGHLYLIISPAEFAAASNNQTVDIPTAPSATPIYPPISTSTKVASINYAYKQNEKAFDTYHQIDALLLKQIAAATPEIFIRQLKHPVTGYGLVTSLQMMNHLMTTYGAITQPELDDSTMRMMSPWTPPSPIKNLFEQLREGIAFALAGGEILAPTSVIRIGYNLIVATGLFATACREWRMLGGTQNMQSFELHFRTADIDRLATTTTGDHYGNLTQEYENDLPSFADTNPTSLSASSSYSDMLLAMTRLSDAQTAQASHHQEQMKTLMAAMNNIAALPTKAPPSSVQKAPRKSPFTLRVEDGKVSYC